MQSSLNYWQRQQQTWQFAYGTPTVSGLLKQQPVDFVVDEKMAVQPSGDGEHVWLHITKCKQNTEQVAKSLARFVGVAYRDVGYSGMKDLHAITHQWFSVWLPKTPEPAWANFVMEGVTINQVCRHNRKIKRGTHQANHFTITVRELAGDIANLPDRLEKVAQQGVPNYFGKQRFGQGLRNLDKALSLFSNSEPSGKKIKQRHMRSLMLSAARSWLFNQVLSARIADQSWNQLYAFEPVNLDASGSCFSAPVLPKEDEVLDQRMQSLDVHPTGPMWGEQLTKKMIDFVALAELEKKALASDQALMLGLEKAGLSYQRRALRVKVNDFQWRLIDNQLVVEFALHRGQFATAVLREIVSETVHDHIAVD